MTSNHSDVDDLIAALRDDLPSDRDQERVRKRLAGIGLFVGASAASPSAHAATLEAGGQALWSVAPKTTVLGNILGLSGAIKAVLVTVALGGSALVQPGVLSPVPDDAEETRARVVTETVRTVAVEPRAAPMNMLKESALEPIGREPIGRELSGMSEPSQPAEKVSPGPVRTTRLDPDVTLKASAPLRASELAEETRLMESAIAASQRGDRAAAARSLDLHAEKFPDGALAPERERLRSRL